MIEQAQKDVMKVINSIPIRVILNPIKRSYARNDFYLRSMVSTLRRVPEPFQTAWNVLAGEGAHVYRTVATAFKYVAHTTFSAISEAPQFLDRAFISLSAKHDLLVGEILNLLLDAEMQFYNAVESVNAFLSQYAGRLEEVVMKKLEELRERTSQLVNSYINQLRPYFQQLDKYAASLRQQLLDSILGLV